MPPPAFRAFPLSSPVMVAAGSVPLDRLHGEDALGAIVTPSYTYHARHGTHAIARETVGGLLLAPSVASPGITTALRRRARAWETSLPAVVVSLLVDERRTYVAAAAQLEGVRGAAAIELNLAWGAADGLVAEEPSMVRQTLRAVRQVCQLPIMVKLRYDLADPEAALEACAIEGAAAVVVAAGVPMGDGMLLGPSTFPLVIEVVRRLVREAPLPVIACGGIATAAHARAYLDAGAAAVQVGSAHLANPNAAVEIAKAL